MTGKLYVLVRVNIAVKRHHDQSNSHKEKLILGASLQLRGLAHNGGTGQHAGR